MRAAVVLAYLACSAIWGTTYFAIRVSIAPGGFATYTAAALRFVIAAMVLGGIVVLGRVGPRPRSWRQVGWICAGGLANGVAYMLLYTAEESITGGLACVIYGTMPLLTAVLLAATGAERAGWSSIVGALVSLGGVVLLFGDRLGVSVRQAAGVAIMGVAVVFATVSNLILKRKGTGVHPLAQNAWYLGTIAVAMTIFAIAAGKGVPVPPPVGPSIAIIYLAIVGSVVAFAAWFYLIQQVTLMTASTIVFVTPVIALVVDALWETQRLSASSYAGVAVTLAGLGVNLFAPALRRPPSPALSCAEAPEAWSASSPGSPPSSASLSGPASSASLPLTASRSLPAVSSGGSSGEPSRSSEGPASGSAPPPSRPVSSPARPSPGRRRP